MAWEGAYYYRKEREGKTVRSVYVGGGVLGELAAAQDARTQAAREEQRAARAQQRAAGQALDADYSALRAQVAGVLTAAGYHQHKREWRRRRGG